MNIDDYAAIRDWLLSFKPELEKRATRQAWFELQQAQLAYHPALASPKIVWPHFQLERTFALDFEGFFLNNKCFFLPVVDDQLLALLNSSVAWFQLASIARLKRGSYIEAEAQYVEKLILPDTAGNTGSSLAPLSRSSADATVSCFELQSSVRHRILDLATPGHGKLSARLHDWWTLDFAAFQAEVQRQLRNEIAVGERDQWERYLAENAAQVRILTAQIEDAEREIDQIVYRLFDLTADEIRLLEDSLQGSTKLTARGTE